MKYILLALFLNVFSVYKLNAQDISNVDVHLFKGINNELIVKHSYEMNAEGENTIDKTIFEQLVTIKKISQSPEFITFDIKADSTNTSNETVFKDGEASLFYAMFGLNMQINLSHKGELIEVLNKGGVIRELENGIKNLSKEARKNLVQRMLNEAGDMLYSKLYEINYAPLLKNINTQLLIPYQNTKDSIIEASNQTPLVNIEKIIENKIEKTGYQFTTTTNQRSDSFSSDEGNYIIEHKPVKSKTEESLFTNKEGLIQSFSIKTIQTMGGMLIKIDGEKRQEMKAITQYSTMIFSKVE